ncbi:MAG: hypothetical protein P1U67_07470 [Alcanivoracaceae bacterium]|nr:hypothetical protein [Alcanivoracaceae bacterium]
MKPNMPFAVIADSSRLGGQLLKKILEPIIQVVTCDSTDVLEHFFADENHPAMLLISHDWPGLRNSLEKINRAAPQVRALLLASRDNDVDGLPALKLSNVTGALTRPYEPQDVINGIVRAMHSALTDTQAEASSSFIESGPPLSMVLERDIAFCKRHGLMLSAIAVQLNDYDELCADIGKQSGAQAQQLLEEKMCSLLRQEDGICLRQPGLIILSLPGTPPLGARVLAHRICAWVGREEIRAQHFNIHFSVNIGIHCSVPGSDTDTQSFLTETANAALDMSSNATPGESHVHLSDYARAITGEKSTSSNGSTRPDSEHFWQTLEGLLKHPELNDTVHQNALMQRLAPILSTLPEAQRLQLVDDLLLASVIPDAAQ